MIKKDALSVLRTDLIKEQIRHNEQLRTFYEAALCLVEEKHEALVVRLEEITPKD